MPFSVFAAGDAMAQKYLENVKRWDYRRSLSMGFLGIIQNGIFLHYWYRTLDRVISQKTNFSNVFKKICADEAIFAPQLACSYLSTSAFISKPYDLPWIRKNVEDKIVETWCTDLKFWPLANFIGFTFIPTVFRPVYASTMQLFWQMYLSSVGFR